jgi:hypothetical protein
MAIGIRLANGVDSRYMSGLIAKIRKWLGIGKKP